MIDRRAIWSILPLGLVLLLSAACAGRLAALPTGPGTPYPDFAAALDQATSACRGVRTITAAMALSGRAGTTKLRGRIDAGFERPASMRLEAPAPFGRPVFVLVAKDGDATLVLYRDGRVLRGAPPQAIVEALAGVALTPDEMRAAVSGCGLGAIEPTEGRAYDGGWVALAAADATAWLRRIDDAWRMAAMARGPLEIRYGDYSSGRPSTVRIRTTADGTAGADLTLRLSQVDINTTLHPETFDVEVPADAAPLTLEELRRAGPLGAGSDPQ